MKRNKFSLSNYKLTSCDMGELVPIGLQEVLPGDTFQHSTNLLLRVSPLLTPVMHPVDVKIHHWFVPHRLVWEDWEDFITGGSDGMDASVFPTINLNATTGAVGTLADYLGIGLLSGAETMEVSALPFRAYAMIFNEFYRDQDLVTPLVIDQTSGADTTTNTTLQNGAWEKDYFTSARPWTQKGPEVSIGLTGDAPVKGIGMLDGSAVSNVDRTVRETPVPGATTQPTTTVYSDTWSGGSGGLYYKSSGTGPSSDANNFLQIYADLDAVTAVNINDLRLAFALQRYEEARARYGSRYVEYLRYLGVRSSDARLQRPEYLGGGRQTIQFSEVLATSNNTDTDLGQLGGHGIAAARSNRYRRFFEEHGYVISLMVVRPKTIYMQALPRTFNRRTKEDFWQRELEHIGQQEILNKEIKIDHATPNGVFGYQDRYDEYRRAESMVTGEFRTSLLNMWHYAREFATDPALNSDFVKSIPTKRVNAVQTNDVLWCMVRHSIQARRQLSKTGSSYIF